MSDHTYNTNHGNFRIDARKIPHLLKALFEHDMATGRIVDTSVFADISDALMHWRFDCTLSEEGDIVDIFLDDAYFGEVKEKILTEVIAPFVDDGSYLVFAFGGVDAFWAISFSKNHETDKVEGKTTDVQAILDEDLVMMLACMAKHDPALFAKLRVRYTSAVHLGMLLEAQLKGLTTAESASTKEA